MARLPSGAGVKLALLGPAMAAIAGIGLLSIMDAVIKHASASHSTPQIAAMRYVCGTLIAFAVFRALRTPWPSRATLRPHIWRSLVVAATALSFFYALAVLPLAVVLALSFTAPIFIALFAALLLGERPDRTIIFALVLGFAGVLVVLWHEVEGAGAGNAWGLAAALTSAVTYALSMVALKSRAAHDPLPTIVLLQNVLPAFIIVPLAVPSWTAPAPSELGTFLIIGALGTGGHLLMASAYKRADASRLGVFEYTAFIWAVGIGFFAFAEVPSMSTLAGAALIVGGALMASRRPSPAPEPEVEIGP